MTVRYDKLWILLIKNKMKKGELAKAAHLSSHTMTQLNNNRLVSMSVMLRLCKVFHCDIGDLMIPQAQILLTTRILLIARLLLEMQLPLRQTLRL